MTGWPPLYVIKGGHAVCQEGFLHMMSMFWSYELGVSYMNKRMECLANSQAKCSVSFMYWCTSGSYQVDGQSGMTTLTAELIRIILRFLRPHTAAEWVLGERSVGSKCQKARLQHLADFLQHASLLLLCVRLARLQSKATIHCE